MKKKFDNVENQWINPESRNKLVYHDFAIM